MKVTFLKDHLGYKAGDKEEVTDKRGQYFVNTGVAKEVKKRKSEDKEIKKMDNGVS